MFVILSIYYRLLLTLASIFKLPSNKNTMDLSLNGGIKDLPICILKYILNPSNFRSYTKCLSKIYVSKIMNLLIAQKYHFNNCHAY